MPYRPVVAVDFDGFMTKKDAYPEIGRINKPICALLRSMARNGAILILWTCRVPPELDEAMAAACNEGVMFDYVNENSKQQIERFNSDTRKVSCSIILDDKLPLVPPLVQALWAWFKIVPKAILRRWMLKWRRRTGSV